MTYNEKLTDANLLNCYIFTVNIMKAPPKNHTHLWNDLPSDERKRLMPYAMEAQLRHIWQCKQNAIAAHKRHMKELDDWMANIKRDLDKI